MCQTAAGRSNHNITLQMFQIWPGRQARCDRGGCEEALLQAASSGPTLCCRHCRHGIVVPSSYPILRLAVEKLCLQLDVGPVLLAATPARPGGQHCWMIPATGEQLSLRLLLTQLVQKAQNVIITSTTGCNMVPVALSASRRLLCQAVWGYCCCCS